MLEQFPRYISNKPHGKDQFVGNSHQRIAKTISEHVSNESCPMRVIGLEGSWGAGKSHVIELMKEELKDSHHTFIYDAWGHQEDLPRRAFLEELTEDLLSQDGLLSEKTIHTNIKGEKKNITWEKKLRYLLSQEKVTEKEEIPILQTSIIIAVLLSLFILLLSIISPFLKNDVSIGIKFSLTMFLLAIVGLFIFAVKEKYKDKEFFNFAKIHSAFKGKILKSTTFESTLTTEPSVKTFTNWMASISKGLTKELVVVFDNMDRLPENKVEELWASIHTFFAEGKKFDKVWVIIPFDRKHLQKAFTDIIFHEEKEEEISNTEAFIDKTFSVIYRVSPPILTAPKKFFEDKYIEAFGNTEDEHLDSVFKIYEEVKPSASPREVIVFLNELVTLKRIWKDEIPITHISVFVLKRDEILKDPVTEIIKGESFKFASDFISKEDLQKSISALVYNVDIAIADEALLYKDIKALLNSNRYHNTLIITLSEHPSFLEIVKSVIHREKTRSEDTILTLVKLRDIEIEEKTRLWIDMHINERCITHCEKYAIDYSFREYEKQLLLNISKENQVLFITTIAKAINEYEFIDGKKHFKFIKSIDDFIVENNIGYDIKEYLNPQEVSSEVFVKYLEVAKEEYKRYKLNTNSIEWDQNLAKNIKLGAFHQTYTSNLFYLKNDPEFTFKNTIYEIEQNITSREISEYEYNEMYVLYKSIKQPPLTTPSPRRLTYKISIAIKNNQPIILLITIAIIKWEKLKQHLQEIHEYNDFFKIISLTDPFLIEEVSKEILSFIDLNSLLALAPQNKIPLLWEVCKTLIDNKENTTSISLETVENFNTQYKEYRIRHFGESTE